MEETWGWKSLKRRFEDQGWFYRYEGEKGGNTEGDKGIKGEVVEGKKNCQGMKVHCWRGLREGRSERWLIAGVEWCSSEVEALHSRILVPKGDDRRLQHWKWTRSHKVSVCVLKACSGKRTVVSSGCVSKENLQTNKINEKKIRSRHASHRPKSQRKGLAPGARAQKLQGG